MDNPETVSVPPQEWLDSLDEAERDAAAGRVVPAAEVHALFKERQRESTPAPRDTAD